jgi:uncharacterized membrane protein YesL
MTPKDIARALGGLAEKLADLCILSACWLVCCLPVVTAAASCAALYNAAARYLRGGTGTPSGTFFTFFRTNWKKGVPLSLAAVAAATLLSAYYYFGGVSGLRAEYGAVYWPVVLALTLLAASVFAYAFPLFSRFDRKTGTLLWTALTLAAGYPLRTAGLLGLWAVCAWVCKTAPLLLFLLPAACCWAAAELLEPVLKRHTAEGEASPQDKDGTA